MLQMINATLHRQYLLKKNLRERLEQITAALHNYTDLFHSHSATLHKYAVHQQGKLHQAATQKHCNISLNYCTETLQYFIELLHRNTVILHRTAIHYTLYRPAAQRKRNIHSIRTTTLQHYTTLQQNMQQLNTKQSSCKITQLTVILLYFSGRLSNIFP